MYILVNGSGLIGCNNDKTHKIQINLVKDKNHTYSNFWIKAYNKDQLVLESKDYGGIIVSIDINFYAGKIECIFPLTVFKRYEKCF